MGCLKLHTEDPYTANNVVNHLFVTYRKTCTGTYRFGFNGKEKVDELYGSNNTYDLGARFYNPRIARQFTTDRREADYPWQSTYAYYSNSPISTIDYNGDGDQYTVKDGDNLTNIAETHKTNVDALAKVNDIKDINKIYTGQVLAVPTTDEERETFNQIGIGQQKIKGVHFVFESTTPEIYKFTVDNLKTNPSNFILTYNGGGSAASKNRYLACGGSACSSGSGGDRSCDEFPYAITVQGGASANTFCAKVGEQEIQRIQLRQLVGYSNYKLKSGDNFLVLPIQSGNKTPVYKPAPVYKPKDVPTPIIPPLIPIFQRIPRLVPVLRMPIIIPPIIFDEFRQPEPVTN